MAATITIHSRVGLTIGLARELERIRVVFWRVFIAELDRILRTEAADALRGVMPVKTGTLRNSVKMFISTAGEGAYVTIQAVFYIVNPRLRGVAHRWIRDSLQRYVQQAFNRAFPIARGML